MGSQNGLQVSASFVLSVPFIFQFWVYVVWFHLTAKVPELREAAEWCQTTEAKARTVGKGLVCFQCQFLGLVGIKGEVHWGHCTAMRLFGLKV